MACPRGLLCKGAVAQPPQLGILEGGVMYVWDTLMRHVRGLCHSTLMEHATGDSEAHKSHKKVGEMKVWVRCARRWQVAYFTRHHTGCTLVSPSTWAKRVPRVPFRIHYRPTAVQDRAQGTHRILVLEDSSLSHETREGNRSRSARSTGLESGKLDSLAPKRSAYASTVCMRWGFASLHRKCVQRADFS